MCSSTFLCSTVTATQTSTRSLVPFLHSTENLCISSVLWRFKEAICRTQTEIPALSDEEPYFHPNSTEPTTFLTWWDKYSCENGANTAWACLTHSGEWSESHRPPLRADPEWFEPAHPEKHNERVSGKKQKQPRGCINSIKSHFLL